MNHRALTEEPQTSIQPANPSEAFEREELDAFAESAIHLQSASVLRMETDAKPAWTMTVETTAEE